MYKAERQDIWFKGIPVVLTDPETMFSNTIEYSMHRPSPLDWDKLTWTGAPSEAEVKGSNGRGFRHTTPSSSTCPIIHSCSLYTIRSVHSWD